jgi:hypothetical protein
VKVLGDRDKVVGSGVTDVNLLRFAGPELEISELRCGIIFGGTMHHALTIRNFMYFVGTIRDL